LTPLIALACRIAAGLLGASLISLGVGVVLLGEHRAGYEPLRDSVSLLGKPGELGSGLFDILMASVAMALMLGGGVCLMTGFPRAIGAAISVSGALLLLAAAVPTAGSPTPATLFHRACTGGCLSALVVAALATSRARGSGARLPRLRRASAVIGWSGAAGLLLGIGLLLPGFPGGLWERFLFGLNLAWVEGFLLYLGCGSAIRPAASAGG
jgi:hypothetical protein